jgi:hypothetical protein
MKRILWVSLIMFGAQLWAQNAIPAGTILPVHLNTSLNSRRVKVGQVITARVMQDVPLPAGSQIHVGAKLIGHVVDVKRANGSQLSLHFDALVVGKERIPVTVNLRALASMTAVEDAQIPETGPDRGTPQNWWTTDQIGGEAAYGGGPVANGLRIVGRSTPNGALVRVSAKPGSRCRETAEDNNRLQAVWLFSSDACGAYGLANLAIAHAGRTAPVGEITLASEHGDLNLRAGAGMLLRVTDSSAERASR